MTTDIDPGVRSLIDDSGEEQQTRWTPRSTHLLHQIRSRILDDDLASNLRRWYPSFTHATAALHDQSVAA